MTTRNTIAVIYIWLGRISLVLRLREIFGTAEVPRAADRSYVHATCRPSTKNTERQLLIDTRLARRRSKSLSRVFEYVRQHARARVSLRASSAP